MQQQGDTSGKPFVGDVVKECYTLQRMIGEGSFGRIFEATFRNERFTKEIAIKFEEDNKERLLLTAEVKVLKALEGVTHFPRFFGFGTHKKFKFVAMELLGPNLLELINLTETGTFSIKTVAGFAIQALTAIEALHTCGFIHRDIKPANFVIGRTKEMRSNIYLIDFGLCKLIKMRDGIPVTPPTHCRFRGTLRYASPNCHNGRENGRQDDLMSLMYVIVEFAKGKLPWSRLKDAAQIAAMKEDYLCAALVKELPLEFNLFFGEILRYDYFAKPNYDLLRRMMKSVVLSELEKEQAQKEKEKEKEKEKIDDINKDSCTGQQICSTEDAKPESVVPPSPHPSGLDSALPSNKSSSSSAKKRRSNRKSSSSGAVSMSSLKYDWEFFEEEMFDVKSIADGRREREKHVRHKTSTKNEGERRQKRREVNKKDAEGHEKEADKDNNVEGEKGEDECRNREAAEEHPKLKQKEEHRRTHKEKHSTEREGRHVHRSHGKEREKKEGYRKHAVLKEEEEEEIRKVIEKEALSKEKENEAEPQKEQFVNEKNETMDGNEADASVEQKMKTHLENENEKSSNETNRKCEKTLEKKSSSSEHKHHQKEQKENNKEENKEKKEENKKVQSQQENIENKAKEEKETETETETKKEEGEDDNAEHNSINHHSIHSSSSAPMLIHTCQEYPLPNDTSPPQIDLPFIFRPNQPAELCTFSLPQLEKYQQTLLVQLDSAAKQHTDNNNSSEITQNVNIPLELNGTGTGAVSKGCADALEGSRLLLAQSPLKLSPSCQTVLCTNSANLECLPKDSLLSPSSLSFRSANLPSSSVDVPFVDGNTQSNEASPSHPFSLLQQSSLSNVIDSSSVLLCAHPSSHRLVPVSAPSTPPNQAPFIDSSTLSPSSALAELEASNQFPTFSSMLQQTQPLPSCPPPFHVFPLLSPPPPTPSPIPTPSLSLIGSSSNASNASNAHLSSSSSLVELVAHHSPSSACSSSAPVLLPTIPLVQMADILDAANANVLKLDSTQPQIGLTPNVLPTLSPSSASYSLPSPSSPSSPSSFVSSLLPQSSHSVNFTPLSVKAAFEVLAFDPNSLQFNSLSSQNEPFQLFEEANSFSSTATAETKEHPEDIPKEEEDSKQKESTENNDPFLEMKVPIKIDDEYCERNDCKAELNESPGNDTAKADCLSQPVQLLNESGVTSASQRQKMPLGFHPLVQKSNPILKSKLPLPPSPLASPYFFSFPEEASPIILTRYGQAANSPNCPHTLLSVSTSSSSVHNSCITPSSPSVGGLSSPPANTTQHSSSSPSALCNTSSLPAMPLLSSHSSGSVLSRTHSADVQPSKTISANLLSSPQLSSPSHLAVSTALSCCTQASIHTPSPALTTAYVGSPTSSASSFSHLHVANENQHSQQTDFSSTDNEASTECESMFGRQLADCSTKSHKRERERDDDSSCENNWIEGDLDADEASVLNEFETVDEPPLRHPRITDEHAVGSLMLSSTKERLEARKWATNEETDFVSSEHSFAVCPCFSEQKLVPKEEVNENMSLQSFETASVSAAKPASPSLLQTHSYVFRPSRADLFCFSHMRPSERAMRHHVHLHPPKNFRFHTRNVPHSKLWKKNMEDILRDASTENEQDDTEELKNKNLKENDEKQCSIESTNNKCEIANSEICYLNEGHKKLDLRFGTLTESSPCSEESVSEQETKDFFYLGKAPGKEDGFDENLAEGNETIESFKFRPLDECDSEEYSDGKEDDCSPFSCNKSFHVRSNTIQLDALHKSLYSDIISPVSSDLQQRRNQLILDHANKSASSDCLKKGAVKPALSSPFLSVSPALQESISTPSIVPGSSQPAFSHKSEDSETPLRSEKLFASSTKELHPSLIVTPSLSSAHLRLAEMSPFQIQFHGKEQETLLLATSATPTSSSSLSNSSRLQHTFAPVVYSDILHTTQYDTQSRIESFIHRTPYILGLLDYLSYQSLCYGEGDGCYSPSLKSSIDLLNLHFYSQFLSHLNARSFFRNMLFANTLAKLSKQLNSFTFPYFNIIRNPISILYFSSLREPCFCRSEIGTLFSRDNNFLLDCALDIVSQVPVRFPLSVLSVSFPELPSLEEMSLRPGFFDCKRASYYEITCAPFSFLTAGVLEMFVTGKDSLNAHNSHLFCFDDDSCVKCTTDISSISTHSDLYNIQILNALDIVPIFLESFDVNRPEIGKYSMTREFCCTENSPSSLSHDLCAKTDIHGQSEFCIRDDFEQQSLHSNFEISTNEELSTEERKSEEMKDKSNESENSRENMKFSEGNILVLNNSKIVDKSASRQFDIPSGRDICSEAPIRAEFAENINTTSHLLDQSSEFMPISPPNIETFEDKTKYKGSEELSQNVDKTNSIDDTSAKTNDKASFGCCVIL
ncbi:putative rho-associated protein kinase 1 [Monocercomonoides exilis]|uniref:putative rho-associated protein kinase 1 n=1 Tax=Monocercomonoides exilis TaxID=2049356 RepID=UPI003559AB4A|nr:putative rho-associated protein kinase 1 [Monocercomonoides exilis]|eukprot:MONOS_5241.1-p1 / transcript=MONOS_5241.1 / gene=MONOS_5241 / organism=Monocercomonoides_exilis_PA203 / gene_product=Chain A, Human Tau Tubulin Kinase 1 / transcript_product=Chain A, Human Tau Tubulin Kinase 1 / location=Mono_scaffold00150:20339-28244(-) / protein_length=2378 / sequence_SO=supercontig / SO=protein_coding / is_pseudo=false